MEQRIRMSILEEYQEQLKGIETRFNNYIQDWDNILAKVKDSIFSTTITDGRIVNPTPYEEERMGSKLKGKIIQTPITSNDCMKYHYDNENRVIMIEEYSVFLKKFEVTEIYIYNELTEKIRLSSGLPAVLWVFDSDFTKLKLAFTQNNDYIAEEFIYNGEVLTEIKIRRWDGISDEQMEIHKFIYDNNKLIQILRVCQNGYRELLYTTKKPNFKKMKEDTYNSLKMLVADYKDDFGSFGIEGFIDQKEPMICVCFAKSSCPHEYIADWKEEMQDIYLYDWQFSYEQEKKCIKMIAEIIADLVEEGLLKEKQIYFHQSQVCVTKLYSGAKTVFKKANINVK